MNSGSGQLGSGALGSNESGGGQPVLSASDGKSFSDLAVGDIRDHHWEFQSLLDSWAEAIVSNDADRIGGFAEPDWQLVTPESGPVPRERFLGAVRGGHLSHSAMAFEVRSVLRSDTVAVVVAHGTNQGLYQGQPFRADEWVTDVFIRRGDRWSCALSSLTPNLSAPAPE